MLEIMSKYNFRYATMSHGVNYPTQYALRKYATNVDLSPFEKYLLLSKCKISVAFNNFPLNPTQISNIKKKPYWHENNAFSHVDYGIAPQFKSRVNEAAALGVINLIERDPWNLVEDFYEPDNDFIYFTDMNDLDIKIKHVIENYDSYINVRKSAYTKVQRYTRKNLYSDISNSLSWQSILAHSKSN